MMMRHAILGSVHALERVCTSAQQGGHCQCQLPAGSGWVAAMHKAEMRRSLKCTRARFPRTSPRRRRTSSTSAHSA